MSFFHTIVNILLTKHKTWYIINQGDKQQRQGTAIYHSGIFHSALIVKYLNIQRFREMHFSALLQIRLRVKFK